MNIPMLLVRQQRFAVRFDAISIPQQIADTEEEESAQDLMDEKR